MVQIGQDGWAVVAAIVSAATVLMGVLMVAYRTMVDSRYSTERHRVELGALREALERQMHAINDRLLSTESRWREVNHLLISSQERMPEVARVAKAPLNSGFLRSFGLGDEDLQVDPQMVFVLIPFHPEFAAVFQAIATTCQRLGLKCYRGDEEYVSSDVLQHTVRLIVRARVVVAVIDGRNPNVFYELGLAQGLDKTTILVSRSAAELPFNVRTRKVVMYRHLADLAEQLQAELARTMVHTSLHD